MSPKSQRNLIPITSSERARELGSMGGKKRSEKKQLAATFREWEKKLQANPELTEPQKRIVMELMDSGESARFQLFQFYAKLLLKAKTDAAQGPVLRDLMTLVEHQHGKAAVKNENVNVNLDVFQADYGHFKTAVRNVLDAENPGLWKKVVAEFERLNGVKS